MEGSVSWHLQDAAATDELERQMRFRRAWEAYHGETPKALKKITGQADDNVQINYAKLIVNKGVSFLFGQDVTFELDETQQTVEEEWLQQCWDSLSGMLLLQKLALNGAVCGHAWAKVVPAMPGALYPRVVVLDPANVSVGLALDDIDRVEWYKIQYNSVDARTGESVVRRQRIEPDGVFWTIVDEESRNGGGWRLLAETPWRYEWPPILDCQNLPLPNEYWGASDLETDILDLSRSIDFVLSNTARIIRFHAHPKTWARGVTANEIKVNVNEVITLQNDNAELHNLEMQSDLGSSIGFYERLREALHEVSQVPEVATGRLENVGQLSGVALQILYQPLIEKTEMKRRTYGRLLVELNRRLLELGGYGSDNVTVIHWPELLPSDPMAERQAALLDEQLGVSKDTLLQKLGYDPDLEKQKREADEAEAGARMLSAIETGQPIDNSAEETA